MMLKGPRTLPRPSATASKIGWCSLDTCSLAVMGVARGIAGSFRSSCRDSTTGFYSSLDGAAADGAVSLPVSDQGSNAYTDVNTLLEQHAGRRPDKIVVESPDQDARTTYGELEALTRRFANFLADEGVGPGDRISLLSDNGIEPLIVFWGALRAGVTVNTVNVEIRAKHVTPILNHVEPRHVVLSAALPREST